MLQDVRSYMTEHGRARLAEGPPSMTWVRSTHQRGCEACSQSALSCSARTIHGEMFLDAADVSSPARLAVNVLWCSLLFVSRTHIRARLLILSFHHDGCHGAEMYKLLLETPHHPAECSGQPVDWDSLFSGLSMPAPAAAHQPARVEAGQAGHVWPGKIIRGPSQDFAVEYASALLCFVQVADDSMHWLSPRLLSLPCADVPVADLAMTMCWAALE